MKKAKRDLLIHFDEENRTIICYSTDEAGVQKIREKEFPLEVPIATYLSVGRDEAEKMMGAGIFSLLELHGRSKIGLRDYASEAQKNTEKNFAEIEEKANKGDAECQYFFALELFNRGVRSRSQGDIETAEDWLKKSAAANFSEAAEYLQRHWERDKASALRGISRG